ncbi:MAG: Gfo/Idh/MocA family oxidoreductase [Lentisphaeria bacterium]|nr:Gfo/Idh/MocA family oxidoreductase [Lentisphaeria bacterium]
MRQIVGGIIGCGVIAPLHLAALQSIEGVKVKYLADVDLARAEKLAGDSGITTVMDYHKLLDDPELDFVSVCTPHYTHSQICLAAIARNKSFICEKPIGINLAEIAQVREALSRHPEVIAGGIFQHRHEFETQLIRRWVEAGNFGVISNLHLNANCFRSAEYYQEDAWRGIWAEEGGSLLINQAIHYIDLLRFWGGEVERVNFGAIRNLTHQNVIETEDCAVAAFQFKSGALGSINASSSSVWPWRHVITISGSEGALEFEVGHVTAYKFGTPERNQQFAAELDEARKVADELMGKDYYGAGHRAQLEDFTRAVRDKRAPLVTWQAAAGSAELVIQIYESAKGI